MGMPEKPRNGMNIAPDGTIYEILEDGSIKRIGKVLSNGEFEPFGGQKEGIRVRDGFIYRVINGKEQKIGRVLPNGDIESINQKIKSEAEISRNNVKIVSVISVCCVAIAIVFVFGFIRYTEIKNPHDSFVKGEKREYDEKIAKLNGECQSKESIQELADCIAEFNTLKSELKSKKNSEKVAVIVQDLEKKKEEKTAAQEREQQQKTQHEQLVQLEFNSKVKPVYDQYRDSDTVEKLGKFKDALKDCLGSLQYDENKKIVNDKIADLGRSINRGQNAIKEEKKKEKEAAEKAAAEAAKAKADAEKAKAEAKKAEEERCRNLLGTTKYEEAKTYYKGWGSGNNAPKKKDREKNEGILNEVSAALTNGNCGKTQVYKDVQTLQLTTNATTLHKILESRCDCKAYKTLKWIERGKEDKEVLKKCKPQCGIK